MKIILTVFAFLMPFAGLGIYICIEKKTHSKICGLYSGVMGWMVLHLGKLRKSLRLRRCYWDSNHSWNMGLQIHKTITIRIGATSQGIGMYLFSSGCDAFRCGDKSRSRPPCDSRSMDIYRILLRARSALHDANRRHKPITKRQKLDVLVLLLAAFALAVGDSGHGDRRAPTRTGIHL